MTVEKFIELVYELVEPVHIDIEEHPEKARIEEDRELAKAFILATKVYMVFGDKV